MLDKLPHRGCPVPCIKVSARHGQDTLPVVMTQDEISDVSSRKMQEEEEVCYNI